MVNFDLAQVNVSRLLAPLDSPVLAEFMAALDEVNAGGDAATGFRWRLQTEDGNATAVRAFGWDVGDSHGVIVNLTTWASVQALGDFAFSGQHLQVMRRRRLWFQRAVEPMTAPCTCRRATGPPPTKQNAACGTYVGTDRPRMPSPSARRSPAPPRPTSRWVRTTTGSARPDATCVPQPEPPTAQSEQVRATVRI